MNQFDSKVEFGEALASLVQKAPTSGWLCSQIDALEERTGFSAGELRTTCLRDFEHLQRARMARCALKIMERKKAGATLPSKRKRNQLFPRREA